MRFGESIVVYHRDIEKLGNDCIIYYHTYVIAVGEYFIAYVITQYFGGWTQDTPCTEERIFVDMDSAIAFVKQFEEGDKFVK